jgi:hypothetical protein
LKVLELIRVNNISGHIFCLKLNASIENESLRTDFQSKFEGKIRYMASKLRCRETCTKTERLYLENPYVKALHGFWNIQSVSKRDLQL